MAEGRRPRLVTWLTIVLVAGACASTGGGGPAEPSTTAVSTTAGTSTSGPQATSSAPPSSAPPTPSSRTPSGPSTTTSVTLDVAGVERTYDLHVPADLPAAGAALVVDLHGLGSSPQAHDEASGMRALADQQGFVVAQPAARGDLPTWNPQPDEPGSAADVQFIREVVEDVAGRVSLDRNAVFASGFSNGGGMAHRLACDAADIFAAVGTVSGQYPLEDSCNPVQPVAIVTFHGTTDLIVPFRGVGRLLPDIPTWAAGWAARAECSPVPERQRIEDDVITDRWTGCAGGVDVLFHTIEGGPHSWPGSAGGGFFASNQSVDASRIIWEFFTAHRR